MQAARLKVNRMYCTRKKSIKSAMESSSIKKHKHNSTHAGVYMDIWTYNIWRNLQVTCHHLQKHRLIILTVTILEF